MVNLHIQKDNPKVVHAFDMEDLGDKAVYCRCWRSKKVKRIHQVEIELGEVPGTGPTFLSQSDGIVTFHSKFPLCDGSHTKHNEETGDNVGPLIIKRKEA
ncbi:CDGSH iron-sulfur domain-containing protein 1 isoform X3 [Dermochelys coriacea]|nr:CDGSH iron-sulfur domain-containing protein 1 isoform X3 [Dermochelys coriacea]